MMLQLVTPAEVTDIAETFAHAGKVERILWSAARLQLLEGVSYALRDAQGVAIVTGGFFPTGEGFEAWFCAVPHASQYMRQAIRAARLTLGFLPQDVDIRVITRTLAGARIATMSGFKLIAEQDTVGIWRYGQCGERTFRGQQSGKAGATPSGSVTAPTVGSNCGTAS